MEDTQQSRRRTIPLARPDIGARELELVTQVLNSDVLGLRHGLLLSVLDSGVDRVRQLLSPTPSWLIKPSMSVWNHVATI